MPAFDVPIEPLVSFLRHPHDICAKRLSVRTDKSYILLPTRVEALPTPNVSRRAFFFDAGASTWSHGLGGSSLDWFTKQYEQHAGIRFSRTLAWEAKFHADSEIHRGVPEKLLRHLHIYRTPPEIGCCATDKLSYFNLPISAAEGDRLNPLSWVRALASVDDFVVFKLDIDTPSIERKIIDQILADPALAALIDELYWEHTVSGAPKITTRLPTGMQAPQETLEESYGLFTRLRAAGIRAHGWV